MEPSVQHAATTIRERFWDPLSLDELARSAMVSKFHFLRMFRRATGVTPGRYLSAVRLHEAKRLLLATSLNVSDIAARVGYSSSGSFTRRFTESVGLSPTQYRRLARDGRDRSRHRALAHAVLAASTPLPAGRRAGTVTGHLHTPAAPGPGPAAPGPARLGVFAAAIPQGAPVAWSTACAPAAFTLTRIPAGTWYVHAVAPAARPTDPAPLSAAAGPLRIDRDTPHHLDLHLTPPDWTRPPTLSALMDLHLDTHLDPAAPQPTPV